MTRYEVADEDDDCCVCESDNGNWVLYCDAQSAIDAERTRADRAEARVKELEENKIKMDEAMKSTYCAYCGEATLDDDEAGTKISLHIARCSKHPMRKVEDELDNERVKNANLRDKITELEARIAELEEELKGNSEAHFDTVSYQGREIGQLKYDLGVALGKIRELEKPKTCEGCEFDYGTNECTRCIRNDDAFKDYYTPRREGGK